MNIVALTIFYSLITWDNVLSLSMQCISKEGKPVDWYVVYKIPVMRKNKEKSLLDGVAFYYMDPFSPQLTFSQDASISDTKGNPIYYTLQQIYSAYKKNTTDLLYGFYNDQPPPSKNADNHGHTKGVIGFDRETGFWLVHSTPHFPPDIAEGFSYPSSGKPFGQTFLCVSYDFSQVDNIGLQLQFTFPKFYNSSFPSMFDGMAPNMRKVMGNPQYQVQAPPWNRTAMLKSKGGNSFISFAKHKNWGKELYFDWLAPALGRDLYVETWQNEKDKLHSDCSNKFKVFNVEKVGFLDKNITFTSTKDHSKWTISKNDDWVCIGGINRDKSQEKRGGGTVCFKNASVRKSFSSVINQYENCSTIGVKVVEV